MTDLATRPVDLSSTPVYYEVNEKRLALLQRTVAKNAAPEEIAMFLELAKRYDLDPFAKEVWCAKGDAKDGRPGTLLIMVGRDGLRKIALRNGLQFDGDVIRAKDVFRVVRGADRRRSVVHEYDGVDGEARGPIVGSWAEVYDEEGEQRGFFVAPLAEYRPTGKKLEYSPWGKQESVMILAAAERQALRQATPLAGLLAEGEDARVDESAYDDAASPQSRQAINDFINALDAPEDVKAALVSAVHRANELAPNSYSIGKLQMTLLSKDGDALREEAAHIERLNVENEERAARRDVEPEVVDAEPVEEPIGGGVTDEEAHAASRRLELMNRIADLEVALESADGLEREDIVGQLESLQEELDALPGDAPDPADAPE